METHNEKDMATGKTGASQSPAGIAIIGMAGRFPGARNVREFWKNICGGVESVSHFSDEELLAAGADPANLKNPNFVRARAILGEADVFDAQFFGYTPREAELMDPQHRLFLETSWHALEDAGCNPARYKGAIGVYAGVSLNTYLLANLCADRAFIDTMTGTYQTDNYHLLIGNDKDFLPTRVSYKLNLRGPSMSVQTACSTSLVAVSQACQALLAGQCDMALAGAVSASFPQKRGHVYQEGSLASADGHCRAFDENARGTVFGDAVAVVTLKRVEDAIADRDQIYAVIKGSAVNNDGSAKVGYTAPSVAGQAEVIIAAQAAAGVSPESISYIEAHGTATPIGDPIEVTALTQAFRKGTNRKHFCAIGTVKTNVGHLEAVSGVTGLIKTALAMKHRVLPASLHFTKPNPKIDFENSPFYVNSKFAEWKPAGDAPLRAGVSSFGVGGTNAHAVLEEAPVAQRKTPDWGSHLLVLSAKTQAALDAMSRNLADYLDENPDVSLADVSFTLLTGRQSFEFRRMLFAVDGKDAAKGLRSPDIAQAFSRKVTLRQARPVTGKETTAELVQRWLQGEEVDWTPVHAGKDLRKVSLPLYPFERTRYWVEPPKPAHATTVAPVAAQQVVEEPEPETSDLPRKETIVAGLKGLLKDLMGSDYSDVDVKASFFELGFDSLFLSQAAIAFRKKFSVKITFRQLLEDLSTIDALADYIDHTMPANVKPSAPVVAKKAEASTVIVPKVDVAPQEPKRFGPFKPIETGTRGALTPRQQKHLDDLIARTIRKTPKSREQTQENREHLADPRTVSSFNRAWKEMVYPIVVERSSGSRFWDIDGNEYVDMTMGFGTNLLGHSPEFIKQAVAEQLERGVEVGPQSPLAGKVAKLICEFTGMDRVAFCNTGSEAVMAAMRVARTVTGRTRIATNSGFHGINDEVLVRAANANGERRSLPIAPGIPEHIVKDVLVLDYGSPESLEILKSQVHELAAVLVEPVQGRRPDLQPLEYLKEVRRITREAETALIFDEVITGFRCHPGGAQALFGIKADIATYGKIIGGGLPIGAVAGSKMYMDALDGGMWQYGDNSFPEVGVTFFAGTYIRHPLVMAASWAVLNYLKEQGPGLQQKLTERMHEMIVELNQFLIDRGVPIHLEHFASFFYPHFDESIKYGGLLYYHLREKGVHIWEGRLGFLCAAHTEADVQFIISAFKESIIEMQQGGFLPEKEEHATTVEAPLVVANAPAVEEKELAVAAVAEPVQVTWPPAKREPVQFSLYCFGNYPAAYDPDKYNLIIESAKFGDTHGFTSIWLPERHFHGVGGYSPNPSLIAAALARETQNIRLHAGSVVLPLHHPVRVAEEWSVVDNLSNGRAGMSIASGWHPNDFVFAPDAFENRREICLENLATIRKLWRGEKIKMRAGAGSDFEATLYPLPKQEMLPVWFTCIHADSYANAGKAGVGVLGYLMNQTVEELADKIRIYRESLAKHGHDPAKGHVTILLHTYVGADLETARKEARGPLREYLRSFLDNSQKSHESKRGSMEVDQEDIEYMLDRAFEDYAQGKSLIGSPESCAAIVENLYGIGVDEIGCFLDFGVPEEKVRASFDQLYELKKRFDAPQATFPLSDSQRGLWMLAEMNEGALRAYNESLTLELRGALDLPALKRSIQRLAGRHEALRTFINTDGETQTVQPEAEIEIPFEDFSDAPGSAAARMERSAAQLLDLRKGPLFRAMIAKVAGDRHLLLFTFHHITCNGPSHWIFMEELAEAYAAESRGETPRLEHTMQPRDYIRWQEKLNLEEASAYWLQIYRDLPPPLELPADKPRPQAVTYNGGREVVAIDRELCQKLRHAGAEQRCSLFMTIFSAFNILLHRLTGQDDVVVGTPFESAVREEEGGKSLFSNTTNLVPLRSRLAEGVLFPDYLRVTKENVLRASEHQEYFVGRLIKAINLPRDLARSPLFSVLFNFESGKFHKKLDGLEMELLTQGYPYRQPAGAALYELYLNVAEKEDGGLEVQCDYNSDLFEAETARRWMGHYKTLLEGIATDATQPVAALPLLNASEKQGILYNWNATKRDYRQDVTLHKLIEEQVELTPDAPAVIFEGRQLTYREFNERANGLAEELQKMGVGPEALVTVCAERSLEMVIALVAILKAGGAYVPIDPMYPQDRIAFMLADANAPVLLTQSHLQARIPQHSSKVLLLDQFTRTSAKNPASGVKPENLAYMIYTSGSTGKPKGAMNTHHGICNRLLWMQEAYQLSTADRVLQKTPFTFDVSVWEFFWPLMTGAPLIVARPGLHGDSAYLIEVITAQKITTMHFVPPMLGAFLTDRDAPKCTSLKRVICSGEALPYETQQKFFASIPGSELHNLYGPTEAAVDVTFWKCDRESQDTVVPIGYPVANTQIYILDKTMQPVPVGVGGELHIGGVQLARGYLGREELTAQKFIPNPFAPGRLYKTGDLAKYRGDGAIEFLGRIDHQVKIRGLRIELEEIETVLAQQPQVQQCVVLGREDRPGEKRLVAYYVPGNANAMTLWPSSPGAGGKQLFDDLQYRMMTNDHARIGAFNKAFEQMVKGKVVLDAGTGKDAILARRCIEAGAKKVYGVELLEKPAAQAVELVKSLGLENKIEIMQGDISKVNLPGDIDVLVSDNFGHIGGADGWDLVLEMARKHLKKDAVIIPAKCQTRIAAVSLPETFLSRPAFAELATYYADRLWREAGYKYDMRLSITGTRSENISSTTDIFENLDFSEPATAVHVREISLDVTRDSRIDGFLLLQDIEMIPGIVFKGFENQDSLLPVYLPVFQPGIDVNKGDRIEATVRGSLAENGWNRDYKISGKIVRKDGGSVPFNYVSYHYKQVYKHNAFYQRLFASDAITAPAAAAPAVTPEKLAQALRTKLPDYMVPSAFVMLDALPLTPNGKIDRRALPAPVLVVEEETPNEFLTPLQEKLVAIWKQVLNVEHINIHANFFEVGGDSLTALRIVNQIREFLEEHVSLIVIFEAPTVAALAELLEKNYADAVARLGGEGKKTGEAEEKVDAGKITVMKELIGTIPPAMPLNGAGKNPRAIFILSSMRSGSTLCRIMLAGNPKLFSPPELQLLMFNTLKERAETWSGYDSYLLEGTIRAVMDMKGCSMEEAQAIMKGFEQSGMTIPKFYRQMQDWIAPRILVDKTPDYAMDIEILKRAELYFEDAFYLHLTRHPLGMIRSYEKGRFILESPYRHRHNFSARQMAELTWLVSHQNILQFLSGVPSARQHRVKFEDLVDNPQLPLEALCKSMGIDFAPGMMKPYEDKANKMTDGIHPLSQQVGDHNFEKHGSLKAEVADKWRSDYTEDFLGEETWRVAKLLGYENPFSPQPSDEPRKQGGLAPITPASRDARRVKRVTV